MCRRFQEERGFSRTGRQILDIVRQKSLTSSAAAIIVDVLRDFGGMMDLRELEKAAREQGWKVDRTRRGHPRFIPADPSRQIVVGSGTPSDRRSLNNLLADLKRNGLIWPWPPSGGKK